MRRTALAAALVGTVLVGASCTRTARPATPLPDSGAAAADAAAPVTGSRDAGHLLLPDERRHLSNLRQLTFGGENAEAYFSFDGRRLVFQARRDYGGCDQIWSMNVDGSDLRRISSGGATTCAYFHPDGSRVLYATTALAERACPPKPDRSQGYVWPLYPQFDIVSARPDGSDVRRLTSAPGYDAEATVSRDGRVVFTSARDGDLELYTMNLDGSDQRRITSTPGYDGGAFFSADGTRLVWRASRPTGPALDDYRALLSQNLVRPGKLEIVVGNSDGSGAREITPNGAANFAPFFHPSGTRVIFASNAGDPRGGREFDLFLVPVDGSGTLERVTFAAGFDGFPMFSPDGRKLVFASNRGGDGRETNVFLADWND